MKLLYNNVFLKHSLTQADLRNTFKKNKNSIKDLISLRKSGNIGFTSLPYQLKHLSKINKYGKAMRKRFKTLIHVGIGGSSLGATAICKALGGNKNNIHYIDNVDPDQIFETLALTDLKNTGFYVVTKSGDTIETLTAFSVILKKLTTAFPNTWKEHLIFSTDPTKGFLREYSDLNKIRSLEIPENVGGRFSALSSVGLFPAAYMGINTILLLKGARLMDAICWKYTTDNPALIFSLINQILYEKYNRNIICMMPYSKSLEFVADWFIQLWAESLGKKSDIRGKVINTGQTPIKAIGARDQHSILQLLEEGPSDKLIVFLETESFKQDFIIPKINSNHPTCNLIENYKISEIIRYEKKGCEQALTSHDRPNLTIQLDAISEINLGKLLYFFQCATVFSAKLTGINPFDQPGVESSKLITRQLLKENK